MQKAAPPGHFPWLLAGVFSSLRQDYPLSLLSPLFSPALPNTTDQTIKPWQPLIRYNAVTCRYSEIGTKGHNRNFFVRHLCEALDRRLSYAFGRPRFVTEKGRLFMFPEEKGSDLTALQLQALRKEIPELPGLSSVSPGWMMEPTMEGLRQYVSENFKAIYAAFAAAVPPEQRTYAMRVNRVDKSFPMRSEAIEREFAAQILPAHPDLRLDLKEPMLRLEVDLRRERIFICCERIPGPGGLPTGSAGKVLAMLSGGFDSPVACYELMRRGCEVDFVTFHSSPYTPPATVTKVCRLTCKLNEYQKRGRLVAVNLLPYQKAVRDLCDERLRTVLYRRAMLRVATVVARYFGDLALASGDNLGQVASQTLENMGVINAAAEMMILRPLLTFDKLDIMAVADKIGTSSLSIEDVPDSCTVFAPRSPTTHAILEEVVAEEAKLDIRGLVRECLRGTVIINPRTYVEHPFTELLECYG